VPPSFEQIVVTVSIEIDNGRVLVSVGLIWEGERRQRTRRCLSRKPAITGVEPNRRGILIAPRLPDVWETIPVEVAEGKTLALDRTSYVGELDWAKLDLASSIHNRVAQHEPAARVVAKQKVGRAVTIDVEGLVRGR